MILLHHSGGASDFNITGIGSPDVFGNMRYNVLRLLRSREQNAAANALESVPFESLEATNHFNDEFSVLHASVPMLMYEKIRREQTSPEFRDFYNQISQAFGELGLHYRFIAVDLLLENDPAQSAPNSDNDSGRRLTRFEINKLVNRYIGVNAGYLGDFNYQTHHDFYLELNLDVDPNNYEGTTRVRFIKILDECTPDVQAQILNGILNKYPVGSSSLRTQLQRDEIARWIARLKGITLPPSSSFSQLPNTFGRTAAQAEPRSLTDKGGIIINSPASGFRFDFGISFAGNDRALARQLRDGLKNAGFAVFYDEDFEHEMIGHDGTLYLRNVYSRECRFCVVLISQAYDKRDWTNLEREAVQARELRGERGILIPVPIEDYQPLWLPETRIRFDLWKRSIPELVALLTKRCNSAQKT